MQPDESLIQCTERLSALPPRERFEAFRAIEDQMFRREVVRALPPEIYSDILAESMLENLRKNVREEMARRERETKPSQAA